MVLLFCCCRSANNDCAAWTNKKKEMNIQHPKKTRGKQTKPPKALLLLLLLLAVCLQIFSSSFGVCLFICLLLHIIIPTTTSQQQRGRGREREIANSFFSSSSYLYSSLQAKYMSGISHSHYFQLALSPSVPLGSFISAFFLHRLFGFPGSDYGQAVIRQVASGKTWIVRTVGVLYASPCKASARVAAAVPITHKTAPRNQHAEFVNEMNVWKWIHLCACCVCTVLYTKQSVEIVFEMKKCTEQFIYFLRHRRQLAEWDGGSSGGGRATRTFHLMDCLASISSFQMQVKMIAPF